MELGRVGRGNSLKNTEEIISRKTSALNFCQVENRPTADVNRIRLHSSPQITSLLIEPLIGSVISEDRAKEWGRNWQRRQQSDIFFSSSTDFQTRNSSQEKESSVNMFEVQSSDYNTNSWFYLIKLFWDLEIPETYSWIYSRRTQNQANE